MIPAQPHKHHEGEITLELVRSLQDKLAKNWGEVANNLGDGSYDWRACAHNWCWTFNDALIRLERVANRILLALELTSEYDGKVVDIVLSILDDYEKAKAINFENPDFKHE